MGMFTDKCKRCGIRYGNNFVKGANTPAGKKGMCAPCWRLVGSVRRSLWRRVLF